MDNMNNGDFAPGLLSDVRDNHRVQTAMRNFERSNCRGNQGQATQAGLAVSGVGCAYSAASQL